LKIELVDSGRDPVRVRSGIHLMMNSTTPAAAPTLSPVLAFPYLRVAVARPLIAAKLTEHFEKSPRSEGPLAFASLNIRPPLQRAARQTELVLQITCRLHESAPEKKIPYNVPRLLVDVKIPWIGMRISTSYPKDIVPYSATLVKNKCRTSTRVNRTEARYRWLCQVPNGNSPYTLTRAHFTDACQDVDDNILTLKANFGRRILIVYQGDLIRRRRDQRRSSSGYG
jgi:hypothetical protein